MPRHASSRVDPALAERLATLRKRAGLTQGALARSLSISPDTVINWEAGRTQPLLSQVRDFLTATNSQAGELFQ